MESLLTPAEQQTNDQDTQDKDSKPKLKLSLITQNLIKKSLFIAQERRQGFSLTPLLEVGFNFKKKNSSDKELSAMSLRPSVIKSENSSSDSSQKSSRSSSRSSSQSSFKSDNKSNSSSKKSVKQTQESGNIFQSKIFDKVPKPIPEQEGRSHDLLQRTETQGNSSKKNQENSTSLSKGRFEILLPSLKRQLMHQIEYQQQQSIQRSVDNIKKNHRKINQIVENLEFKIDNVIKTQETNMIDAFKVNNKEFITQKKVLLETVQDLESMQELNDKIIKYIQKTQYLESQLKEYGKMYEQLKVQNQSQKLELMEKEKEIQFYQNEAKKMLKENTNLQLQIAHDQEEIAKLSENNNAIKSQFNIEQAEEYPDLKILVSEPTPKHKVQKFNKMDFNPQFQVRGYSSNQTTRKTHSIFNQFQKEVDQKPHIQTLKSQQTHRTRACVSCTQQSIESIISRPITQSQIKRNANQDTSQQSQQHELQIKKIHESYQKQIQALQAKYKQLLENRTQAFDQKSELEDIFISCILQVKKNISKRKGIEKDKIKAQDFQFFDKQQLVELLLSDEIVIAKIYEALFPQKGINTIDFLKTLRNPKTPSGDSFQSSIIDNLSNINHQNGQSTDENIQNQVCRAATAQENTKLKSFMKSRARRYVKSRPENENKFSMLNEF